MLACAAKKMRDEEFMMSNPHIKLAVLRSCVAALDQVIESHNIPQPYCYHEIKCDTYLHVVSTEQMEEATPAVFAQQTIGGKTLQEMTLHNEQAFANRMYRRQDKIFMKYLDDVSAGLSGNIWG